MVRGIALLGVVDSPGLRKMAKRQVPIVFVNRKPPQGIYGPFVGIDNRRAGGEIARHFIERGFRPCGAIHGPLTSSASPSQRPVGASPSSSVGAGGSGSGSPAVWEASHT